MNLYMEDIMDEMKFRRTHLRGRGGGVRLKGGDPSLEAVTDPDPMGQWAWLSNVMETAEKKRQNVMEFQSFFFTLHTGANCMNISGNSIHSILETFQNALISLMD